MSNLRKIFEKQTGLSADDNPVQYASWLENREASRQKDKDDIDKANDEIAKLNYNDDICK